MPQDPTARVAQQNGERESLGVSSGVLQVLCFWAKTLSLRQTWPLLVLEVGEPFYGYAANLDASPCSGS